MELVGKALIELSRIPFQPFYRDESCVLYNADCAEIMPYIEGGAALVTDPPFGINFAGMPTKGQRDAGMKPKDWDSDAAPIQLLETAIFKCKQAIIWGGNYFDLPITKSWLSWYKPDAPPSMGNFELAWTNLGINTRQFTYTIAATNPERVGHPTQKPLALMRWCIGFTKAETILDLYAGSGTTLVAAKLEGRFCIGIERDLSYCRKAVTRLSQGVLFNEAI